MYKYVIRPFAILLLLCVLWDYGTDIGAAILNVIQGYWHIWFGGPVHLIPARFAWYIQHVMGPVVFIPMIAGALFVGGTLKEFLPLVIVGSLIAIVAAPFLFLIGLILMPPIALHLVKKYGVIKSLAASIVAATIYFVFFA